MEPKTFRSLSSPRNITSSSMLACWQGSPIGLRRAAQPGRGLTVKVDRRLSVSLENRARCLGCDRSLQTGLNGFGFSLVRHTTDNRFALHDLANRHRNGAFRNFPQVSEPSLPRLLPSTGFVEMNHNVRSRGFEVRRRVIEGEVAVFSNSDEGHIDRMLTDQ